LPYESPFTDQIILNRLQGEIKGASLDAQTPGRFIPGFDFLLCYEA
jgi:hypothetical protein